MFVHFLLVTDLLFILFMIALWPSAGKELSVWLFICVVLILVLVVRVPFPFGVWGRMWNTIVSVPDHCLFIYSSMPSELITVMYQPMEVEIQIYSVLSLLS